MKKTALFFGSFNPIHIGHLIIAEFIVERSDVDDLWFVISPSNPLKKQESLLHAQQRYYMTQVAIEDDPRFKACDIEFKLPYPSYTAVTLAKLTELYPERELGKGGFFIIILLCRLPILSIHCPATGNIHGRRRQNNNFFIFKN